MNSLKLGFFFSFLLILPRMGMGQFFMKKGDLYFNHNHFQKAIEYYLKETENKDSVIRTESLIKLAKAYKNNNQHHLAFVYFKKLHIQDRKNPQFLLEYASAFKRLGKYANAKKLYTLYQEYFPKDKLAGIYISSCDSANVWMKEYETLTEVKEMKSFNSRERDFAPAVFGKLLVFNSGREDVESTSKHKKYAKSYLDFYYVDIDQTKSVRNHKKARYFSALNTGYHEGPASFSQSGNIMFFTRTVQGERIKRNRKDHLNIFYRVFKDGDWGEPRNDLPFNSKTYSNGHPSFCDLTQTLYFMSDRPDSANGLGGADLYMSKLETDGSWSTPLNLGNKINSAGNELFPFISMDGKKLYFSSNGHEGLGGLDIFYADWDKKANEWGNVHNMRAPINAPGDDFGFVHYQNDSKGFFSSGRPKGMGDDDIYSFAKIRTDIFVEGDSLKFEDRQFFDEMETFCFDKDSNNVPMTKRNDFIVLRLEDSTSYKFENHKEVGLFNKFNVRNVRHHRHLMYQLDIISTIREANLFGTLKDGQLLWPNRKIYVLMNETPIDTLYSDMSGKYQYKLLPHKNYRFNVYDDSTGRKFASSKYWKVIYTIKNKTKVLPESDANLYSVNSYYNDVFVSDTNGRFSNEARDGLTLNIRLHKDGYFTKDTALVFSNRYFKANKDTLFIILTLEQKPTMEVRGTLLDNGKVVADADIILSKGEKIIQNIKTDKQGKYTMKVNASESYDMTINKPGFFQRDTVITFGQKTKDTASAVMKVKLNEVKVGKEFPISNIYYDYNSYKLNSYSQLSIQKLVHFLNANPKIIVELSSHTDSRGDENYNLLLSQKRAEEAVKFAISSGISSYRFHAKGYGETLPVVKNATTEVQHQKNRRTQLKVVDMIDPGDVDISYRVFLAGLKSVIPKDDNMYLKLPEMKFTRNSNGIYLYYLGPFANKDDADECLIQAEDAGFKSPYIEKLNNGIFIEKLD